MAITNVDISPEQTMQPDQLVDRMCFSTIGEPKDNGTGHEVSRSDNKHSIG